ncbi:MAG: T9SS type A sorting domain-containing protein [Muribaculaceae bacterium]|nr:T9SS type A sorting domain-containing protein [Muribaculaceae bacterium]
MSAHFLTYCNRYLKGIMASALLMSAMLFTFTAYAAPGKWEQIKSERTDTRIIAKDSDTEIRIAKGVVVVNTTKQTQVKIYTILGQIVSRDTLPAGMSQITIHPHGVYIIKIGDLTCKAAL